MKELSIEQKAKAYDEVVSKLKGFMMQGVDPLITRNDVQDFFPELAESEDERIRKAIKLMYSFLPNEPTYIGDVPVKDIFAWLEKQGKKTKPIEGFNTEFERQVSCLIASAMNKDYEYTKDFVKWTSDALLNYAKLEIEKNSMGISEATKKKLEDNLNKALEKETPESWNKFLEKQGKQNPIDKVDPKFKVGDEIKTANEESLTITKIDEKGYWSEDLFICGFDYADKWKLVEQKPVWSEEDGAMFNFIALILRSHQSDEDFTTFETTFKDCIDWLKSLKERYTWKPSDEQMDALYTYIYNPQYFNSQDPRMELVESVYQDLKKLREE